MTGVGFLKAPDLRFYKLNEQSRDGVIPARSVYFRDLQPFLFAYLRSRVVRYETRIIPTITLTV